MTMMMMMIMGGAHLLHGQIHCLLCRFEAFSSSNDKKPKPLRDVQVQIGNYSTAPNKTVQKNVCTQCMHRVNTNCPVCRYNIQSNN